MPTTVSTVDLWKLLVESGLVTERPVEDLEQRFLDDKGDVQTNTLTLAQWLMSEGILSRYQAKVLLAGRPGPFVYGDYLVHDRHAEGRLQGTFRATHPGTKHRVLLQFHTGSAVQNVQQWAAVVESISKFSKAIDPHLARIYHLADLGQYKFTVMDDLQGETAAERAAKGAIPPAVACRMIRHAALGAARLLAQNLLHGAIRPDNLWIDKQGNVQLLLAPLARDPLIVPRPGDPTRGEPSSEILQQADYFAPEMSLPKRGPDAQTEVYAIGCTLFYLLTGRAPYAGGDLRSRIAAHTSQPVPQLDLSAVPAAIAQVVAFAMAKDPAKRFRNPAQMAETIGKLLERIDRTQLRWPPSLPPSRLPEYEAWLRPYGVRSEEPGRASGMNVVWSPQAAEPESMDSDEAVDLHERRLPPHANQVPGGQTATNAFVSKTQLPDLPLDWMAPDPRGPRGARGQQSMQKATLIITVALVILCIIGGIVTWLVLSKRISSESNPDPASGPNSSAISADVDSASNKTETGPAIDDRDNQGSDTQLVAANSGLDGDAKTGPASSVAANRQSTADGQPTTPATSPAALWASPTNGRALSTKHLAPGLQAFFVVRPADIFRHPEGEKTLAALGPDFEAARRELESVIGGSLAEVEQLTVAWVAPMSASMTLLQPMAVLRFRRAPDRDKIAWSSQPGKSIGQEKILQSPDGWAAWWPSDESGAVLVLGPDEVVEEAAKLRSSPPVRRELERLLSTSDSERSASLLFLPSALNDVSELASPDWKELLLSARQFYGSDIRAGAISAHLSGDNLFVELRVQGPLDRPAAIVAEQFHDRLNQLPRSIEAFIGSLKPSEYAKQLLQRFPQMVTIADEFTRSGVDGRQAVLRCYLPAVAAQNLLTGTELAIAENVAGNLPSGPADAAVAGPQTIEQKLKQVTSLTFARDTLEKSIQLLADDIGIKAEILGPDLQLEGITKNQSFGLDEKDKPADEILRDIMLKANPDGKLVYVVKTKEAGGDEMLLVTTRAAAAKRGDKLPPELMKSETKAGSKK